MDILIKIEMLLILTTFTGSVFYGIWCLFSKISEKYHIVAYIYYALKVVIFLFIVPVDKDHKEHGRESLQKAHHGLKI